MPCLGRWFIGPHAVTAYRERVNPKASYQEALTALILHSERAHFVRRGPDGIEHWRAGRPLRIQFRVAPPECPGNKPVLMTVLGAHESARHQDRGELLSRGLRVLRAMMRANGATWRELGGAAGTRSERTIRRDVEALMRAGLPVELERGRVRLRRSAFFDWIDQCT